MQKNASEAQKEIGDRLKKGDNEAFIEVYDTYITPIYRFVYFRVPSKNIAEDLCSDIFLKVWKYRSKYKDIKGGTLKSWIYTIARNTIIDWHRTKKESTDLGSISEIPGDWSHTDPMVSKQIKAALEKLTPDQQDVLRLRFWHEMSFDEIANVLGKSSASCRVHASRGVQSLKDHLPRELFLLFITINLI